CCATCLTGKREVHCALRTSNIIANVYLLVLETQAVKNGIAESDTLIYQQHYNNHCSGGRELNQE
ncbi:MAG: hypothetical protein P1U52_11325, partial [Porticoccaceae bacterium]|nr:hypothetical protein [Porticoccaceae bacterium]